MWGVRLDSGDLVELSHKVRKILDDAGLRDAKIMATGDLNDQKLQAITDSGAPIDVFGVGTALATSSDAPNLSAVYKMVEIRGSGGKRYTAKQSAEKSTVPASKQVFRFADHDLIAGSWECPSCSPGEATSEALLRPTLLHGQVMEPIPSAREAREYCIEAFKKIQPGHRVEYSAELLEIMENLRA